LHSLQALHPVYPPAPWSSYITIRSEAHATVSRLLSLQGPKWYKLVTSGTKSACKQTFCYV